MTSALPPPSSDLMPDLVIVAKGSCKARTRQGVEIDLAGANLHCIGIADFPWALRPWSIVVGDDDVPRQIGPELDRTGVKAVVLSVSWLFVFEV